MSEQVFNQKRQAKKRIMKNFKLKSGKQYREWLKTKRREEKADDSKTDRA